MSIDQIIALAASVGACFAAIATFLTVWEMKKQRESSYRPELIVAHVVFESFSTNNLLPVNWVKKPALNSTNNNSEDKHWFTIPIYNIGMGVAKEVTLSWTLPISDLLKKINELAQNTMTSMHLNLENDILSIKSNTFPESTILWRNENSNQFNYILHTEIDKDPLMIKLPHTYRYIVSILLFLSYKKREGFSVEIPPLKISFEYLDIANTRHRSIFDIYFNLTAIGDKNNGIFFNASLDPKRIIAERSYNLA